MKHVHIMGIGGSGASAVAAIAKAQGFEVSGCDLKPNNEFTKDLGLPIFEGHSSTHLNCYSADLSTSPPAGGSARDDKETDSLVDILAISPALLTFDPQNPELVEAKNKGVEVLTWQEFMGKYLEKDKFVIAISGTHGKSTTTAMIGKILEDANLDPTVELGAIVPKWGRNYRVSKSKGNFFVTEADEYNNNFLVSHPNVTVVLNIDYDHPDFFKAEEEYKESFEKFLSQTKETIIANISDPGVAEVTKWVMKSPDVHPRGVHVVDYSKSDFNLDLQVFGKHNLLNAQAAFHVGLALGIDSEKIRKSLNNFRGIGRRLELIGEVNGAKVYSDFGHHPTEIKASVLALQEKYPDKKLLVIFQPHLFSRTKLLFDEFVQVFEGLNAEKIMIAPIYPAREKDPGDINSKMLVEAIGTQNIQYLEDMPKIYHELTNQLTNNDLVLFIGAGDTDKWARELVSSLGV